MDVKEIKRILELLNGVCSETNCADCEYRNKEIGRPYTCKLDEEEALSEAVRIIEEQEERIAIMSEGEKHGHWIFTGRKNVYGGSEVVCSHCIGTVMIQNIEDEKYCRTCGAIMDEPPVKVGKAE